jgi:hypothetical protein
VPGKLNKVADLLSRYYLEDTPKDKHLDHVYMNTDTCLHPEGEMLPAERFMDLCTVKLQCSTRLKNRVEPRTEESAQMNEDLLKGSCTIDG